MAFPTITKHETHDIEIPTDPVGGTMLLLGTKVCMIWTDGHWKKLTRGDCLKQWLCYYAPIPWKRCMVCSKWFFNKRFWHWSTWGLPENCNNAACDK